MKRNGAQRKAMVAAGVAAAISVASLTGAEASQTVTPENPLHGWVSQGSKQVMLGYVGGGCVGTWHPGEPCLDIVGAFDVQPIAAITPGVVHLRISAPVQLISVSQVGQDSERAVQGSIHQTSGTEADITFGKEVSKLRPVEISFMYEGKEYGFAFGVQPALWLVSVQRHAATVTTHANVAERGVLAIKIERHGKMVALKRLVITHTGEIKIEQKLRGRPYRDGYEVRATLSNSLGHMTAVTNTGAE